MDPKVTDSVDLHFAGATDRQANNYCLLHRTYCDPPSGGQVELTSIVVAFPARSAQNLAPVQATWHHLRDVEGEPLPQRQAYALHPTLKPSAFERQSCRLSRFRVASFPDQWRKEFEGEASAQRLKESATELLVSWSLLALDRAAATVEEQEPRDRVLKRPTEHAPEARTSVHPDAYDNLLNRTQSGNFRN